MTGHLSCYLDNSATTRPFDEVISVMASAMASGWHNPSAAYAAGVAVETMLEEARGRILAALGARGRLVFTSGGTEADNLAILGAAGSKPAKAVTGAAEHPAASAAFSELASHGHEVVTLPVDVQGRVTPEAVEDAVDDRTAFVSVMHVNNETGAVADIAALAAAAKRKNPQVLFHSDGVQAFLRVPAEPERWGVDLYSVSAHKVHGPKGAGALYAARGARLSPRMLGGGQEGGLRSGTENVPGILGFARAVELLSKDLPGMRAGLMALKLRLAGILLSIDGAQVNGPTPEEGAPHILNVSFEGVQGEVLLRALSEEGVYVSTGSACGARRKKPSPVLQAMGLSGERIESAVRFSLSPMNGEDGIDRAGEAVSAQVKRLRKFKRR